MVDVVVVGSDVDVVVVVVSERLHVERIGARVDSDRRIAVLEAASRVGAQADREPGAFEILIAGLQPVFLVDPQ